MQLEIRNAVERDQLVYNGLGLLFGAIIAVIFFRRVSLMLLAALPPVLAVLWSLGLLGWLGFKLNLFLNVMTPLVMVMGFADSMQMVSAIRIRLREGDNRGQAVRFAVRVVGPACVLAHGVALLSFLALLFSQSGLIRTFGMAGALAVVHLLRRRHPGAAAARADADPQRGDAGHGPRAGRPADGRPRRHRRLDRRPRGALAVSDHAGRRSICSWSCGWAYLQLEPRYRLADQVPDREQALGATGRIDQKLTGANPGAHHDRVEDRRAALSRRRPLEVIAKVHEVAGEGGGPRQRLVARKPAPLAQGGRRRAHRDGAEVRRASCPSTWCAASSPRRQNAVLVTGRLPDIDSSHILPVVEKIDRALDGLRKAIPRATPSRSPACRRSPPATARA